MVNLECLFHFFHIFSVCPEIRDGIRLCYTEKTSFNISLQKLDISFKYINH